MIHSGHFITFEGGEGAGKTSVIREMARLLSSFGTSVLVTREPGGTQIGESIRSLLLETASLTAEAELALFLASRAQHIAEKILPALKEGRTVLCDRFNDSTIAYQGAGRGLGMKQVAACCELISQGVSPDLTLYLDIDPQIGLARVGATRSKDRIEAEELHFHNTIRQAYLEIARQEPNRFVRLDASQPLETVIQEALHCVRKLYV